MCGIAGALIFDSEKSDTDIFWDIVGRCSSRGQDSFGVLRWHEETGWSEYKSFNNNIDDCKEYFLNKKLKGPSFYLHTSRAEPTTEWKKTKTKKDIPPFRYKDIAVAHNGIVCNDKEIAEKFDIKSLSSIDTSILPEVINKIGAYKTLAEIRGGTALGIIDANAGSFLLCRNFMPLSLAWNKDMILFASEISFFPEYDSPFAKLHFWTFPHYSILEVSPSGYKGPFIWNNENTDTPDDNHWKPFLDKSL